LFVLVVKVVIKFQFSIKNEIYFAHSRGH